MDRDNLDAATPAAGSDREKLHWEIEKLRAETEAIRRPPSQSIATLATVITALVAIVGAGFQYQRNQVAADRAAWEADKVRAETRELELDKAAILRSIEALESESLKVGTQLKDAQGQLEVVRTQLAQAETASRAAATPASTETADTLAAAQVKVADLQKTTRASEQVRDAQAKELGAIKARVMAPTGLRLQ